MRWQTLIATLCVISISPCATAQTPERVILISVDGLHAGHLAALMAGDLVGDFASFQRFVDEGSTTFNARTDYTHTNTAPNHTCMITGRPVLQPFGMANTVHHGYTVNVTPAVTDTYHNSGNPNVSYIASVFDVAHDHGLTTGCYISKDKLLIIDQSYDATTGAADPLPPDDGNAKIDLHALETNLTLLNAALLADLANNPADFSFVHYNAPDLVGHASGWGSPEWDDAVREIDDLLGELFALVDSQPALAGKTVLILTADHGGIGTNHSDESSPEVYTIPFFVWGPGIAADEDLYASNLATRQNPGSGRPQYNGGTQPIRNGDAANLSLDLLGLPAVPGSLINADQNLRVDGVPTATPSSRGIEPRLVVAPNPASSRTRFEFVLGASELARIEIFTASGRRVRTVVDRRYPAGAHVLPFDTTELASGVYFARLRTQHGVATSRLLVLR